MKNRLLIVIGVFGFVFSASWMGAAQQSATVAPAVAAPVSAVPNLISYSGVLRDSGGRTLTSGTGVTFLLYENEQGGAPLWVETQNVTPDRMGHYTVQLGATTASGMPAGLFVSGQARWLAVVIGSEPEQTRAMLVAVPYAMKAGDAETIGGLPPSAFVLAAPVAPASAPNSGGAVPAAVTPAATLNVTTSGGTVATMALWDTTTDVKGSAITQTGSGATAKIGINSATPAATLDVNGTVTVRGLLNMAATGNATAAGGKNSQPLDFVASAFKSGATAVVQKFQWQAEPAGNNTANPAGTLNLLYASGSGTPAETGLRISPKGLFTFASGQTFPGTGTITGVNAGIGLVGGGTKGTVALSVDGTLVPFLTTENIFSSTQAALVTGVIGLAGETDSSYGVYGSSNSSDAVHGDSGSGTGVAGTSSTGYGVYGSSPNNYAVVGVTTSGNGVYGQVSTANQAGLVGRQEDSSGNWGIFAFGNIGATGTKSSVVTVENGTRQVALYAVESPGVWFEDYGSGQLVSGVATVTIDPAYAQTVNTGVEYHVFLTPDGDCEGLYVTARTATSFEVRELRHGTSNVTFDYRIIALRRGYETKRLADVTKATPRATIETPRPGHAGSVVGTATAK